MSERLYVKHPLFPMAGIAVSVFTFAFGLAMAKSPGVFFFLGGIWLLLALFGSYGWGDGEWMRTWESDCDSAGVSLVCESVICTETPDNAALEACRALGRALAV